MKKILAILLVLMLVVTPTFFVIFKTTDIFSDDKTKTTFDGEVCLDAITTLYTDGDLFKGTGTASEEFVVFKYVTDDGQNESRNVDSCCAEVESAPYRLKLTFTDELSRDPYTGIIDENEGGYLFIDKSKMDENLSGNELAVKDLTYTVVGGLYKIEIPSFNAEYELGEYVTETGPTTGESWYTWGDSSYVRCSVKAMEIEVTTLTTGTIEIDFTHPTDTGGQTISFFKEWVNNYINNPFFELDGKPLKFTSNSTHYNVSPPHFSTIGIHESATGETEGTIYNGSGMSLDLLLEQDDGYGWCNFYDYENKYLYVGDDSGETLRAYTWDSATETLSLKNTETSVDAYSIWAGSEDYIYVATYSDGVYLYSFDGTTLSPLDNEDPTGHFLDVWGNSNYVFFANGTGFIQAYNYGENTLTRLLGNDLGRVMKLWANDTIIHTGAYRGDDEGRQVIGYTFDGSTYTEEYNFSTYSTYGFSTADVFGLTDGTDGYVFVTGASGGLYVFDYNGDNITYIDSDSSYFVLYVWANITDSGDIFVYCAATEGGVRSWKFDGTTLTYVGTQYDGGSYQSVTGDENYVFTSRQDSDNAIYRTRETFVVDRLVAGLSEVNNCSFYPSKTYDSDGGTVVTIKIPVSNSVSGILNVSNVENGWSEATAVDDISNLINNTFFYDSNEQFVHIGIANCTTGTHINWSINCSSGVSFSMSHPRYLEVGQYWIAYGFICDENGDPIDDTISTTHVYLSGVDQIIPVKWYCTDGNYQCTIFTTELEPAIYTITIEFTDSEGSTFSNSTILYLSVDVPGDIFASSKLHFNFYDSDTGEGLAPDLFKIYVADSIDSIDSGRIYRTYYNTYTGQTLYYRIDDYFDNQVYPTSGTYETVLIENTLQFEDVPIIWYDFSVKNMNHSIVWFNMTNGSIKHSVYLYPYEPYYFKILEGEYNFTLRYYNSLTGAFVQEVMFNRTVDADDYYWIVGYDLNDIIIEINLVNTTVDAINISITTDINAVNSNIDSFETSIQTNINLSEVNLTNLFTIIDTDMSIVDSVVDTILTKIDANFTFINSTVNTIDSEINHHFSLMNVTVGGINSSISSSIAVIDSTVDTINNEISVNFDLLNSTISSINTAIQLNTNITDSHIVNYNEGIWALLNLTDAIINYINLTMWANLTTIDSVIDTINNEVTVNFGLLNTTISNINTAIQLNTNITDSHVINFNELILSSVNISESIVDYLNATVWSNLTVIDSVVDIIDNEINSHFSLLNSTISSINTAIQINTNITDSHIINYNEGIWASLNISDAEIAYMNLTVWGNLTDIANAINSLDLTIDYSLINSSIYNVNANLNTSLAGINTVIQANTNLSDTRLSGLSEGIWNKLNTTSTTVNSIESDLDNYGAGIWTVINATDAILTYMNSTIWGNFTDVVDDIVALDFDTTIDYSVINDTVYNVNSNLNVTIAGINTNIQTNTNLSETRLANLNEGIWASLNSTTSTIDAINTMITYVNDTIWGNLTSIRSVVISNFNTVNNSLAGINTAIQFNINTSENRLAGLSEGVWGKLNSTSLTIDSIESDLDNYGSGIWDAINVTDAILTYINSTIWGNLTMLQTSVDAISTTVDYDVINHTIYNVNALLNVTIAGINGNIQANTNATDTALRALSEGIWNSVNTTYAMLNYLNESTYANFSTINTVVDGINDRVTVNFGLLNVSLSGMNTAIQINTNLTEDKLNSHCIGIWAKLNDTSIVVDVVNTDLDNYGAGIWDAVNTTDTILSYINSTIWGNLTTLQTSVDAISIGIDYDVINHTVYNVNALLNTSLAGINTAIQGNINLTDTALRSLCEGIWNAVNSTDTVLTYINGTMWGNLTTIYTVVDGINSRVTVNFALLNTSLAGMNGAIQLNTNLTEDKLNSHCVGIWAKLNDTYVAVDVVNADLDNYGAGIWDAVNTTGTILDYINGTVWGNLTGIQDAINGISVSIDYDVMNTTMYNVNALINTSLAGINAKIQANTNSTEVTLKALCEGIWNAINTTSDMMTYLNNTIWGNLTNLQNSVDAISLSVNYDLINSTIYNVNANLNTTIAGINTNIQANTNSTSISLSDLNSGIWALLNDTDVMVSYINETIWGNLTDIQDGIDAIGLTVDYDLINSTIYNVNANINTTIAGINTAIQINTNTSETRLVGLSEGIWDVLNTTNDIVSYINETIWNNLTDIQDAIDIINVVVDYDVINATMYNVNALLNVSMAGINTNIQSNINDTDTTLRSLNEGIWNTINTSCDILSYMNETVWENLTGIRNVVDSLSLNIDYDLINTTIYNVNSNFNTSLAGINVAIQTNTNDTEVTLKALCEGIWSSLNTTDVILTYINGTIWDNLTGVQDSIDVLSLTIDYDLINSTIYDVNANLNVTIAGINTNIQTNTNSTETVLKNLNEGIWASINATDVMLTYVNNTIWGNLTTIQTTVDGINSRITVNFGLLNTTLSGINAAIQLNTNTTEIRLNNHSVGIWAKLNSTTVMVNTIEADLNNYGVGIWEVVNATDTILDYINGTIWGNLTNLQSSIDAISVAVDYDLINNTIFNVNANINSSLVGLNATIQANTNETDVAIRALCEGIWNAVNLTDGIITYINNTIWGNLTTLQTSVDAVSLSVDYDLINNTVYSVNSNLNTTIAGINANIQYNANLSETRLVGLNEGIWSVLNSTDTILTYINETIWNNLTTLQTSVDSISTTIDYSLINSTIYDVNANINVSLASINANIQANTNATEVMLKSLNEGIWGALNTTSDIVTYINNTIWGNLTTLQNSVDSISTTVNYDLINASIYDVNSNLNVTIAGINTNIQNNINSTDATLRNLCEGIWNAVNTTDVVVGYLNNTIWGNLTNLQNSVNAISLSIDYDVINASIYNVNANLNTTIAGVNTNIQSNTNATENTLKNLCEGIWVAVNATDLILDYINGTIWGNLTDLQTSVNSIDTTVNYDLINATIYDVNSNLNVTIAGINTNIQTNTNSTDTKLTGLCEGIWAAINTTDGVITYINNTIWGNLTTIDTVVDGINDRITVNFGLLNTSLASINGAIQLNTNLTENKLNSHCIGIWTKLNSTSDTITVIEADVNNYGEGIWSAINTTNTILTYLNNTIWGNLTNLQNSVDAISLSVNYDLINGTMYDVNALLNTTIAGINTAIQVNINGTDTKLTGLTEGVWSALNTTDDMITYINSTVWGNLTTLQTSVSAISTTVNYDLINASIYDVNANLNVTIAGINTAIQATSNSTHSLCKGIWGAINITDLILDYINSTIWSNLSSIESSMLNGSIAVNLTDVLYNMSMLAANLTMVNVSIGNLVNVSIGDLSNVMIEIWGAQNISFSILKNRSKVMFSFYNTNDGLGLPWEALRIYINGTRLTDYIYECENGTWVHLEVKDYYNLSMYDGHFNVSAPFTSVSLGLTFHSWLFGNMNEDYYMISILKDGATRWWERGIVPYGEREFMIPSGTYCFRIYDKDDVEIYNSTLPESIAVANSRVYVIHGTNLSLIISGQSVIYGELLEISSKLQPDIVEVGYQLPHVYSVYDTKGDGMYPDNITRICPAQILMATTYNTSYANCTSTPLVPSNTTANGTIVIEEDRLWFQGVSSDYVNISYTSNGTSIQNTSYIPTYFDPDGATITINGSINSVDNITMERETRYQQLQEFYWTKYLDDNYYTTTVNFSNSMDTTIYDVFLFISFAHDETPDYTTVEVTDVTNDAILSEGEHYDISAQGVHMSVSSMGAGSRRLFTVTYYAREEVRQPNDAIVVINSYDHSETYKDKSYYYLIGQWINRESESFIGSIHLQFNFTTTRVIAPESVEVWDETNIRYLYRDEFVFTPNGGVTITQDTVGVVSPQSERTYKVYYLYKTEETVVDDFTEVTSSWIKSPLLNTPFGAILGIHVIGIITMGLGLISVAGKKNRKLKDYWFMLLMVFILFLCAMSYFIPS